MKILRIIIPIVIFILILFVYLDRSNIFKFSKSNNKVSSSSVYIPKITFKYHIDSMEHTSSVLNLYPQTSDNTIYSETSYISPYTIADDIGFSFPPSVSGGSTMIWSRGGSSFSYSNNTYFYTSNNSNISSYVNPYIFINQVLTQYFGMISVKFKYLEEINNNSIIIKVFPVISGSYIYDSSGRYYEDFSFYSNGEIKSFTIKPIYLTSHYGNLVNVKLNSADISEFGSSVNFPVVQNLSVLDISSSYYMDSNDSLIFPIYLISANADIINQSSVPISLYVPEVQFK